MEIIYKKTEDGRRIEVNTSTKLGKVAWYTAVFLGFCFVVRAIVR